MVLPDIYRLRADLLDLLPEAMRQPGELVDAQDDRLRYAMLSPSLCALPDEEKPMAALALARPALVLQAGKLADVPENWRGLLDRHAAEIAAAAAGTGLVMSSGGQSRSTGFIVAPKLLMTLGYALDTSRPRPPRAETSSGGTPRFCLRDSADECLSSPEENTLEIGKIIYDGKPEGVNLMLAELPGHDPALTPPLPVADTSLQANEVIGKHAYVVGYPFDGGQLPALFVKHLLHGRGGQQRLMPGRILAFGASPLVEDSTQKTIASDISTSSGTGGGPLVDLSTGKVVGMSYAGRWQGKRGKFAYAEPIPAKALEIIRKRLGEEPKAEPSPDDQGQASDPKQPSEPDPAP